MPLKSISQLGRPAGAGNGWEMYAENWEKLGGIVRTVKQCFRYAVINWSVT